MGIGLALVTRVMACEKLGGPHVGTTEWRQGVPHGLGVPCQRLWTRRMPPPLKMAEKVPKLEARAMLRSTFCYCSAIKSGAFSMACRDAVGTAGAHETTLFLTAISYFVPLTSHLSWLVYDTSEEEQCYSLWCRSNKSGRG